LLSSSRMAAYTDADGWANKQFLGKGVCTAFWRLWCRNNGFLQNHILAATCELQNARKCLPRSKQSRFELAKKTQIKTSICSNWKKKLWNEASRSNETKRGTSKGFQCQRFCFCYSRKFIWDAMAVPHPGGNTQLPWAYTQKGGQSLWEKRSTLRKYLELYSEAAPFDYPLPGGQVSVHASICLEWNISYDCFNFWSPESRSNVTAMALKME